MISKITFSLSQLREPDESLLCPVSLPPYSSRQVFDACTTVDQKDTDALGRTVPNVHSEAAVSGEAIYIDDIPEHQSKALFLWYIVVSMTI